jgi:drug/metabolite transporter (DMT)-like permease
VRAKLSVRDERADPTTVPALTILAGWLLLGEQPSGLQAAGLVTVLAGFYLAQRQR